MAEFEIKDGILIRYNGSDHIVSVPGGVTAIGKSAFENNTALIAVDLPAGLTSIGEEAFDDCKWLTDMFLPDSVTELGEEAFEGCDALRVISMPAALWDALAEAAPDLSLGVILRDGDAVTFRSFTGEEAEDAPSLWAELFDALNRGIPTASLREYSPVLRDLAAELSCPALIEQLQAMGIRRKHAPRKYRWSRRWYVCGRGVPAAL